MNIVEFDNVSFEYAVGTGGEAVSNLDCTIEQGTFVGVTGPSEAGKTTFTRLLPGYIPHFYDGRLEGTISVSGLDTRRTTMADLSEKVGLVFENPFNQLTGASMTVLEEVAFGLEQKGLPKAEILRTVDEYLGRVDISELVGRHPGELSGGQLQRLAIASILAMEPELLVLDEPTSQLDPHGTNDVFNVLAGMDRSVNTMLIVSQDLDRLAPHLDRLIVMDDGEIVLDDTPQAVFRTNHEVLDRINVPEPVEIGKRLRRSGLRPRDDPLPLRTDEVVEELQPHVSVSESSASAQGGGPMGIDRDGDTAESETKSGDPGEDIENPLVDVEDIHYFYEEDIHALRGITLNMDEGCVCIIGQNGAGKTTFVKHLNGLLKPSEGRVVVDGRDTRDYRMARLAHTVGLNFQNPNDQVFNDTVEEELRYGPKNLGFDRERIDQLVDREIDRMDLEDVRETNPYNMGLARRKHVAVASVLAMDTPIVVLDEPTGGQDRPGTELLGRIVRNLVDDGRLVITITHDINFAREHADRIVALCQGEVLLDGNARSVLGQPERLAETMVEPPKVTQIADALGIPETVLTVEELFEFISEEKRSEAQ